MGDDQCCDEYENVTGECMEMCPKAEILVREETRRLAVFEIVVGTESNRVPKANHNACIKEYTRSAAGCKIDRSKLRPAHVLQKCMSYLIDEIVDQDKHGKSWVEIFEFVSDRVRAIRQDMVVQRIQGDVIIDILNKAVRFHIVVMEECKSERNFDRAFCLDQLHGCLLPLMEYVKTTKNASVVYESHLYYVLLNLKSTSIALNSIRGMLQEILYGKENVHEHAVFELSSAYIIFNYHKLFKIFERLPYIASCCLVTSVNHLRIKTLNIIQKAFSSKNSKLPLETLTKWLRFDSCDDAREFCNMVGLNTDSKFIHLNKTLQIESSEFERLNGRSNWRLIGIKKFKSVPDYVKNGDKF